MADVVELACETLVDLPAEKVLRGAANSDLSDAVVVGWLNDAFYFSSTTSDLGKVLILIERGRTEVMQMILASEP